MGLPAYSTFLKHRSVVTGVQLPSPPLFSPAEGTDLRWTEPEWILTRSRALEMAELFLITPEKAGTIAEPSHSAA